MNHLELDEIRHDLAKVCGALDGAVALVPPNTSDTQLAKILALALAKSREVLQRIDQAMDGAASLESKAN